MNELNDKQLLELFDSNINDFNDYVKENNIKEVDFSNTNYNDEKWFHAKLEGVNIISKFKIEKGSLLKNIYMNEDKLCLITNKGTYYFCVKSECYNDIIFYDFYGANKILNKKIISIEEIHDGVIGECEKNDSYIKNWGYKIVVKDNFYGQLTACFSLRNISSYEGYGGNIKLFAYDKKNNKITLENHFNLKTDQIKTDYFSIDDIKK